jgi:hypothetical protein
METTHKYLETFRGQTSNQMQETPSSINQNTSIGKMEESRTVIKVQLLSIFQWAYNELG